ncbi:hypothetical protein ACFQ3Z_22505 [Streptomyces nogalater]
MTSTTPIFPVRYWDGVPVPFITAWSQEQVPPQELLRVHHSGTTSLGLRGETDVERQFGVSWMRMPVTRGGRPQHGRVHALRQRQAMSRMLCQLCGGPTVGARKDEWTLFLAAGADGHPLLNGERTESPRPRGVRPTLRPALPAAAPPRLDGGPRTTHAGPGWPGSSTTHAPSNGSPTLPNTATACTASRSRTPDASAGPSPHASSSPWRTSSPSPTSTPWLTTRPRR